MKKVLFMLINMNIGGTEKAFLNMLDEMPQNEYQVTLLMLEEYGGFVNEIPKCVEVKYIENFQDMKTIINQPIQVTVKKWIQERHYIRSANLLVIHILSKLMRERSLLFKYVLRNQKILPKQYDVAVAYAGPMEFITYFIAKKVKASVKVQWIHFDVAQIGFNKVFAKKYYKQFTKVFVVSNQGKEKLLQMLPTLRNKTETFLNCVSTKRIKEQGEAFQAFKDEYKGIRILTVGRLSEEKGQDLCIEACKRLKENGYKVRWYCVGEGNYRSKCENLIKKYKLEKDFILLGEKQNPYPYMKSCNYYVQSSRHEGYCITLAEAKVFNKSIVSTDFTGAREQITDDTIGKVVPVAAQSIYEALRQLMDREHEKR